MKRTALARKPKKRRSPNVTTKADVLFSRLVRERDGHCLRCGSFAQLQAAHIWSRRYRATRWRFENCITLCSGCHMYFTLRPAEWAEWCEEREFCIHGVSTPTNGHVLDTFTYAELRDRALNDPPEKAADALARLGVEGQG